MRPISSELERAIADAAQQFATKVASAINRPSVAADWADQTTCAPLTKRKFLALVANGELPARSVGKQRLVRRRDIDRYIERHPVSRAGRATPLTDAQIEARVLADLDLAPNPTKEQS